MNWVGGSRKQVMKWSELKKQKEFFAKKRRQKWQNHPNAPASPKGGNTGNIDLLTMFIVNQIALKKEPTGKPKITYLTTSKGTHKCMSQKPLELPMSPCSPSHLILTQSDPHYSVNTGGLKRRKQSLLEEFKFKALSPVLEANHSDNSASDYKHRDHHHQGSVSSFSSASPTSEVFQSRHPVHISSPPLWDASCTKTSQPMEVCEYEPWSAVSHKSQFAQNNPPSGAQFGIISHSLETNGPSQYSADEYPPNPLEQNDQQDEPLFLGFRCEEYEGQDFFSDKTNKLLLQEQASPPPTGGHSDFSESFTRDHSADFLPQPIGSKQGFRYADCRPCSAPSSVSSSAYEMPVRYSQRVDCVGLDTNNMQYTQPAASHKQTCHCEDITAIRSQHCLSGTSATRRVLSLSQKTDPQSVIIHENTFPRTRNVETQTTAVATLTCQDASVQCCLLKTERKLSTSTEHTALHKSTHRNRKATTSTTRRQTGKSNKSAPNVTQCTLSEIHKVKWNTPWQTSTTRATQQVPEAITGQESSCKSKSRAPMSKHPLPTPHCSYTSAPDSKENLPGNMLVRRERCEGHKEESVNQNPAENAWSTEEHGREGGVNWISGETETLQEIADILLMLKQKNKHP